MKELLDKAYKVRSFQTPVGMIPNIKLEVKKSREMPSEPTTQMVYPTDSERTVEIVTGIDSEGKEITKHFTPLSEEETAPPVWYGHLSAPQNWDIPDPDPESWIDDLKLMLCIDERSLLRKRVKKENEEYDEKRAKKFYSREQLIEKIKECKPMYKDWDFYDATWMNESQVGMAIFIQVGNVQHVEVVFFIGATNEVCNIYSYDNFRTSFLTNITAGTFTWGDIELTINRSVRLDCGGKTLFEITDKDEASFFPYFISYSVKSGLENERLREENVKKRIANERAITESFRKRAREESV
jgi:hypothetical protein